MRGLIDAVAARLDARLERGSDRPVVVGLSGGGDSLALLILTCDWARRAGRRVVAVTVDHGLNAESPAWSVFCHAAAQRHGAAWIERRWTGLKPDTGLPAAARHARHALLAEAARSVGARVILLAHTVDDRVEADWMRDLGSTLGDLREWSPSPAWPQGRGLMLFRPMLEVRRDDLRIWLTGLSQTWIEDPANDDPRFHRSRARAALTPLPAGEGLSARRPKGVVLARKGEGSRCEPLGAQPITLSRQTDRLEALGRSIPLPLGEGFDIGQSVSVFALAATLLCVAGTVTPPRRARLDRLVGRLRSGDEFTSTLSGARMSANGDRVIVCREPGRSAMPRLALDPEAPTIWDGRYEIIARSPGWTVAPVAGLQARLSAADRRILAQVVPFARPTLPVLMRDDGSGPRLAWREAQVRALGPRRLFLTLGETTHERDLDRPVHGETPPTDLFSEA